MAVTIYEDTGSTYADIFDNNPPAGATYSTSMSVSGPFSVAAPLGPNLLLTDISADVPEYSFSDVAHTLTQDNSQISAPSTWPPTRRAISQHG